MGAGVSICATEKPHSSWLGLLKHGLRYLEKHQIKSEYARKIESKLDEAFSPFDLDKALKEARYIEENLKHLEDNGFANWLESAFADFKVRDEPANKAPLEALRDLQQAGALLMTTNYDNLLSDMTGLPPVTWQEHDDFYKVVAKKKPGILHIHGHWQKPASVVLATESYDRIVTDTDLQDLFKSLWLHWTWIYVGCGNGLDDPNLGKLLDWSKRWGESALPDFCIAIEEEAVEIEKRTDKPKNLTTIGYSSHEELPRLLQSISPRVRPWPFVRVDDDFDQFRRQGLDIPFPSRQEYLDGEVPKLAVDDEIEMRFEKFGWASVIDSASVGKTTLALRIASSPEQRHYPVYYLDLKKELFDDEDYGPAAALSRLARPNSLLILDNAHHHPKIARDLWEQWENRPADSRGRLLIVSTRLNSNEIDSPDENFAFFEEHSSNPSVMLEITPKDMGRLAKHIFGRIAGKKALAKFDPPEEALSAWRNDYRAALNAFTIAVMNSISNFQKGDWSLPQVRASLWVRRKWLDKLGPEELENLTCLATFGSQELELYVENDALPFPGKTGQLDKLDLLAHGRIGRGGMFQIVGLREPGWGDLILAGLDSESHDQVLLETSARNLRMAIRLSSRLMQDQPERLHQLWEYLSNQEIDLASQLLALPLNYFTSFLVQTQFAGQLKAADLGWNLLLQNPQFLARTMQESQLQQIGSFLKVANNQGRNVDRLWTELVSDPDKFADNAFSDSLHHVGSFLGIANKLGRDTKPLWDALEKSPSRFANTAWADSLHHVGSFLTVAKKQKRNTDPMWEALEEAPDKFAANAWSTSLGQVGSFLRVAKNQGRKKENTERLWAALEKDFDKFFYNTAWGNSLQQVASFLEVAYEQERDTKLYWRLLIGDDSQAEGHLKFAEAAFADSLNHVGSFLTVAHTQGHDTKPLWNAFEKDFDRLSVKVWANPYGVVGSFLAAAAEQNRDTSRLWQVIENDPAEFAKNAWSNSLQNISSLLATAKQQGRETESLWDELLVDPKKFAEVARNDALHHVRAFLFEAKSQGRKTKQLWDELLKHPDKIADRAWETTLDHVVSFMTIAKQQGRSTTELWKALAIRSDRFEKSVKENTLERINAFLGLAIQHGQDISPYCQIFAKCSERLAEKSKQASIHDLVTFARIAPLELHPILLQELKPGNWNSIPATTKIGQATWLAWRCSNADRKDLADDLKKLLLKRASTSDFEFRYNGFERVCWLLANVDDQPEQIVNNFMDAVCTANWINRAYKEQECGQIATALRQLALGQRVDHCRRFHQSELGNRLTSRLNNFSRSPAKEKSQTIQLLGSVALIGWPIERLKLRLPFQKVAKLPVDTFPHRSDTSGVEVQQLQLWLGLRTFVSLIRKPLRITKSVIVDTRDRWKINLESESNNEAMHELNLSMITWLDSCIQVKPSGLVPSEEPLRRLTGFSN